MPVVSTTAYWNNSGCILPQSTDPMMKSLSVVVAQLDLLLPLLATIVPDVTALINKYVCSFIAAMSWSNVDVGDYLSVRYFDHSCKVSMPVWWASDCCVLLCSYGCAYGKWAYWSILFQGRWMSIVSLSGYNLALCMVSAMERNNKILYQRSISSARCVSGLYPLTHLQGRDSIAFCC